MLQCKSNEEHAGSSHSVMVQRYEPIQPKHIIHVTSICSWSALLTIVIVLYLRYVYIYFQLCAQLLYTNIFDGYDWFGD